MTKCKIFKYFCLSPCTCTGSFLFFCIISISVVVMCMWYVKRILGYYILCRIRLHCCCYRGIKNCTGYSVAVTNSNSTKFVPYYRSLNFKYSTATEKIANFFFPAADVFGLKTAEKSFKSW